DQERFDSGDLALSHACSASPAWVPLSPNFRPAASSSSGCSLIFLIGTIRQTLEAGRTLRQSAINCLYALPTLRILRSRSNSPSGLTLPFCSRSAVSQSIWSVRLYHVKPTVGIPTLRRRSTLARSEEHTSELQSRSDLVCR